MHSLQIKEEKGLDIVETETIKSEYMDSDKDGEETGSDSESMFEFVAGFEFEFETVEVISVEEI